MVVFFKIPDLNLASRWILAITVSSYELHGVSIHRPLDYLLNRLLMLTTMKTRPVMRKTFTNTAEYDTRKCLRFKTSIILTPLNTFELNISTQLNKIIHICYRKDVMS